VSGKIETIRGALAKPIFWKEMSPAKPPKEALEHIQYLRRLDRIAQFRERAQREGAYGTPAKPRSFSYLAEPDYAKDVNFPGWREEARRAAQEAEESERSWRRYYERQVFGEPEDVTERPFEEE